MGRTYPVVWTRPALDSLLEITHQIKADNPAAARAFAEAVRARVGRLRRFPNSGRQVPEFPGSGLREIIFGDYRVIYTVVASPPLVQILTVRYGARQLRLEVHDSKPQRSARLNRGSEVGGRGRAIRGEPSARPGRREEGRAIRGGRRAR